MRDYIIENLNNKRILVSGGTGFVGKNLLLYLQKNNVQPQKLTIITRNASKFKTDNPGLVTMHYLDFLETDICNLTHNQESYDYIIHAATTVVDKVESIQLLNEIILGVNNILKFAASSGASSFINISSGAVYGPIIQRVPVSETCVNYPKIESVGSSYGLGKLISEHYSYLYAEQFKFKATSLRCFCFGGDYLDSNHYVLGYLIKQALANKDIVIQSGSGVYRSYLSTYDLIEWMLYILIQSKDRSSNYDVYNVGSDEAISIHDLAEVVKNTLQSQSKINYANLTDSSVSFYVPNTDKINQLSIRRQYNLAEIIQSTASFYLSNKQI